MKVTLAFHVSRNEINTSLRCCQPEAASFEMSLVVSVSLLCTGRDEGLQHRETTGTSPLHGAGPFSHRVDTNAPPFLGRGT